MNAEEGAWNRNPVLALCGHEVSRPKMMKPTPSCTKIHHDSSLTRSGTWQDDVLGIVRLFFAPPYIRGCTACAVPCVPEVLS